MCLLLTSHAYVRVQLQLEIFKEHMELESQPALADNVAFGVPDDSAETNGPGGENSGRFKPLGEWCVDIRACMHACIQTCVR